MAISWRLNVMTVTVGLVMVPCTVTLTVFGKAKGHHVKVRLRDFNVFYFSNALMSLFSALPYNILPIYLSCLYYNIFAIPKLFI